MDTGCPMDGLTANQMSGYASRSDGSLGRAEVNDRFLGAGFVATKTNSRIFALVCPRAASGQRHRTAEQHEKCASLHVQPRLRRRHRNDKNEHFGRGLEWTSVQVIAPHDQCLRWVNGRKPSRGRALRQAARSTRPVLTMRSAISLKTGATA